MARIRCNFDTSLYVTATSWLHKLFDTWVNGSATGVKTFTVEGQVPAGLTKETYGLRIALTDGSVVRVYGYSAQSSHCLAEELSGAVVSQPTAESSSVMMYSMELIITGDGVYLHLSGPNGTTTNLALSFPQSARHNGVDTSRVAVLWRYGNSATWTVVPGKGYLQNGAQEVGVGAVFGLVFPVWAASVTGTYDPIAGDFTKLAKVMAVRDLYGDGYEGSLSPVLWPALLGADDGFSYDGRQWRVAAAYTGTNDTLLLSW